MKSRFRSNFQCFSFFRLPFGTQGLPDPVDDLNPAEEGETGEQAESTANVGDHVHRGHRGGLQDPHRGLLGHPKADHAEIGKVVDQRIAGMLPMFIQIATFFASIYLHESLRQLLPLLVFIFELAFVLKEGADYFAVVGILQLRTVVGLLAGEVIRFAGKDFPGVIDLLAVCKKIK